MPVEIGFIADHVQKIDNNEREDTNSSHQIVSPGDIITR